MKVITVIDINKKEGAAFTTISAASKYCGTNESYLSRLLSNNEVSIVKNYVVSKLELNKNTLLARKP